MKMDAKKALHALPPLSSPSIAGKQRANRNNGTNARECKSDKNFFPLSRCAEGRAESKSWTYRGEKGIIGGEVVGRCPFEKAIAIEKHDEDGSKVEEDR